MKKHFIIATAIMLVAFVGCKKEKPTPEEPTPVVTTMDYSKAENWLRFENNPTKEVDMFYILPTIIMNGNDTVVAFSDENKVVAESTYLIQACAIEPYTNVYAPFYKQIPLNMAQTSDDSWDYVRMIRNNIGIKDVYAALDYFFEKMNNGRPYILASHSQGTATMRIVLDDYMKEHPEYYSRMVAAYAIGFALPQSWFEANPHLKFATGEEDTGVIIGWNTEGPGAQEESLLLSGEDKVINPLNWSTTTDYMPVTENHGRIDETYSIVPGIADAQIDYDRCVLICTTITDYIQISGFGDKSLHESDWKEYYINIRENAKKRIEAYLGHEVK